MIPNIYDLELSEQMHRIKIINFRIMNFRIPRKKKKLIKKSFLKDIRISVYNTRYVQCYDVRKLNGWFCCLRYVK